MASDREAREREKESMDMGPLAGDEGSSDLRKAPPALKANQRVPSQARISKMDESGLQYSMRQIEASRDALLEEVSYLSGVNAQLEDRLQAVQQLVQDCKLVERRNEALLLLLGEKEEELQAALVDGRDVRLLYQEHIQELLNKLAPPSRPAEDVPVGQ